MNSWDSGLDNDTGVKIVMPNGSIIEKSGSVTAQEVKDIVKGANIRKFNIKNGGGKLLYNNDFPFSNGNIIIEEYNEAK
jgi:hypothetical protein